MTWSTFEGSYEVRPLGMRRLVSGGANRVIGICALDCEGFVVWKDGGFDTITIIKGFGNGGAWCDFDLDFPSIPAYDVKIAINH